MEITTAVTSSRDANIVEGEIRARPLATQDVISLRLSCYRAMEILNGNVVDDDPVGRLARRSTVQVILLDINAIRTDILDLDVAVGDARDVARGPGVRLDARAILVVQHLAVFEEDVGDIVVGLSAYAADGETVSAITVHVPHGDAVSRRHCNTIVLVAHP